MKTLHLLLMAAGLTGVASTTHGQSAGDVIPGRYIVQLKPGIDPAAVAARQGVGPRRVFRHAVRGFSAEIPPGLVDRLARDPDVLAVVPDRVVRAIGQPDPVRAAKGKPGGGGGGGGTSQSIPAGITRVGSMGTGFTGAGVGVAIIDTGIDFQHADLAVSASAFTAHGTSAQDDHGHGTHVAGTVAARNNAQDVVGVAPGATLYAVKVLNAAGSGSDEDIIGGLDWIAANALGVNPPIRVANASLGRPGSLGDNPVLREAVQAVVAAGVTVVVAAGNDCNREVSQSVPATYPEVIAVAATTAIDGTTATSIPAIRADTACHFTSDGAFNPVTGIGVTLSAPGEDRENILKGNRLSTVGILSTRLGGGTTRMSGTSMAAPHVAGAATQIHQKFAGLTAAQVRFRLIGGAAAAGTAPLNSPVSCFSFDGEREGVLSVPGALAD